MRFRMEPLCGIRIITHITVRQLLSHYALRQGLVSNALRYHLPTAPHPRTVTPVFNKKRHPLTAS